MIKSQILKDIRSIFLLTVVLAFALSGPAFSQKTQKIAILVNDQPISEFDITQRARLLKLTGSGGNTRSQATKELIEERLKLQEAKRLGITVAKNEVDTALLQIAKRTKTGTVARLTQALSASGIDARTLRDRFTAEIAWNNVVRRKFRSEIRIREADIVAAIKGKDDDGTEEKTVQYTLSQVIVVIPKNASNTLAAERKRVAERIRQNVRSCANLRSVASAFRDVTVRDIGNRTANQMPENIAAQLAAIPVGQAGAPEKSRDGLQLFVVCDKAEVTGFEAARTPAETELRNEQGIILARRLLRDLRADALIEYR